MSWNAEIDTKNDTALQLSQCWEKCCRQRALKITEAVLQQGRKYSFLAHAYSKTDVAVLIISQNHNRSRWHLVLSAEKSFVIFCYQYHH